MADYLDFPQARAELFYATIAAIRDQAKVLLEEKHLYQSVEAVEFDQIAQSISRRIPMDNVKVAFEKLVRDVTASPIIVSETISFTREKPLELTLLLQNVKLYCSRCGERETFSPVWYTDATRGLRERNSSDHRVAIPPHGFQLFAAVFQCETCKSMPVSFFIERRNWKLTLAGRSPFEEVAVPKYVPRPEKKLFTDAIVAARTGNALAGLFYLRCFIEQFGRRQTGIRDRQTGETILDAYQATLPPDKRDHMPSLKSWYERLSAAMHEAIEDEKLFDEALKEILEHFDFRRMFKIPDATTNPANVSQSNPNGQ